MSSLFNDVLRNLIAPQSIDNLEFIAQAIEAYKDPYFLKYSTLSEELNKVLAEDEHTRYEQLDGIEYRIKDCLDSDIPESITSEDFEQFVRFCDHVKLETGREKRYLNQQSNMRNYIQSLQSKATQDINLSFEKKSEELDKKSKSLEQNLSTNIVAVLGIFAAVVLSFTGGITLLGSIFNNLNGVTPYRLSFAICATGFVFYNVIYLLLNFIARMCGKDIEFLKNSIFVNTALIVFIIATFLLYFIGK